MNIDQLRKAWNDLRTAVFGRSGLQLAAGVPTAFAELVQRELQAFDAWYAAATKVIWLGPVDVLPSEIASELESAAKRWAARVRTLSEQAQQYGVKVDVPKTFEGELREAVESVGDHLKGFALAAAGVVVLAWLWRGRK